MERQEGKRRRGEEKERTRKVKENYGERNKGKQGMRKRKGNTE